MRQAVLLVNLGSPDSPFVPDVRKYLREFLSDPRVLDAPWLIRQLVLHLTILPTRPIATAEAYQKIWLKEGSPLVVTSRRVQSLLQEKINLPVELAMRYGNPSLPRVIQGLLDQKIEEILLLPLYPHYAMSSYETVVERVREVLSQKSSRVALKILPPFYDDSAYVHALVAVAQEQPGRPLRPAPTCANATAGRQDLSRVQLRGKEYDHLLFTFHGLPERHLKLADPSKRHCLVHENCCDATHEAHQTCYRAQAFKTVEAFVRLAKVPSGRFSVSFQSRLGREPWMQPYTDHELEAFPSRGIKKLVVISPSFVSDCLETLEELGMRGKEAFLKAGGSDFTLVPCLNDHPLWIEALRKFVFRLRDCPGKQAVGCRPSAESYLD